MTCLEVREDMSFNSFSLMKTILHSSMYDLRLYEEAKNILLRRENLRRELFIFFI